MSGWTDRRKKHDWRSVLTDEEAEEVRRIDDEVEKISARRHELSRLRIKIQNRATQRFKYENGLR